MKSEVTSWFMTAFGLIYIPHSYLTLMPSLESVELLEDSIMTMIKKKDLEELYKMVLEANLIGCTLTKMYLIIYDESTKLLKIISA